MIRVHNSYSKKLEDFIPQRNDEIRMYTCGPTVYRKAHIGNMRVYTFSDVVSRTLKFFGYRVLNVMNITDIGHLAGDGDEGEDKVEMAAKELGKSASEVAKFYTDLFMEDLKKLNISHPYKITKATEYISEQIFLIKVLEDKGYTYTLDDGIYFNVARFPKYFEYANKAENERSRIGENTDKLSPHDFALWKFSKGKSRLQEYESPWGVGFPGWHIECSAMALKVLGDTLDIHIGGEDLKMTHHPNEIAQSECVTDQKFVKYWLHCAFLNFKSEKMSKSKGNVVDLDDILKNGVNPMAVRYYFLSSNYRGSMNFTDEGLEASKNAVSKLYDFVSSIKINESKGIDNSFIEKFAEKLSEDFNTAGALSVMWDLINSMVDREVKLNTLLKMDEVLGLRMVELVGFVIPKEVDDLAKIRWTYKKEGIFDKADYLRREIEKLGYEVLDTKEGYQIKKIFK